MSFNYSDGGILQDNSNDVIDGGRLGLILGAIDIIPDFI